jgi:hypothetical protein
MLYVAFYPRLPSHIAFSSPTRQVMMINYGGRASSDPVIPSSVPTGHSPRHLCKTTKKAAVSTAKGEVCDGG